MMPARLRDATAAAMMLLSLITTVVANPLGWQYSQQHDDLRDTTVSYAVVSSDNSVKLSFPYGETKAKLALRSRDPRDLTIYIEVTSGQLACFQDSTVSVRFDDGPVQDFDCDTPSDGSTTYIFLTDAFRFFTQLKKAQRLIIEAPFFQDGSRQFTFQIVGLNWT